MAPPTEPLTVHDRSNRPLLRNRHSLDLQAASPIRIRYEVCEGPFYFLGDTGLFHPVFYLPEDIVRRGGHAVEVETETSFAAAVPSSIIHRSAELGVTGDPSRSSKIEIIA